MEESYPFPIYSGLLEPAHYNKIGTSIWLFLWCVSSITKDKEDSEGVTWGIVLGNKPIKLEDLAEQFGVNKKTVSRWIEALEGHEYIRVKRAPYGLIFTVKHSKKYQNKKDKNVHSESIEETKMSTLSQGEETNKSTLKDKNVHSNKDIIKTLIDRLIDGFDDHRFTNERCGVLTTVLASMPENEIHLDTSTISKRFSEIDQYYLQRKCKIMSASSDFEPMMQLAKMRIPMEFILFGMDLSFARHERQKKWPTDEINLFSYCQKAIIGTWNRLQSDIKIASAEVQINTTSVETTNQPFINRNQQRRNKVAELRRQAEEERQREKG